jgi:hypothetical protein
LSVCGPDILTIAIPLGPFPEDNAKIFILTRFYIIDII